MNIFNNELYLQDVENAATDNTIDWEKFENSKILITGASGLIGSFIVDVLMYRNEHYNDNIIMYLLCRNEQKLVDRFSNYKVKNYIDKSDANLKYIIQDVCNEFNFSEDFDYIIHAASNTHPKQYSTDPVGTITTNIIGLNNILKYSVVHRPKRIMMISSVEIYGENRGDVELFDENYLGYINCNTARAGYPESKRLGEALCQSYISQYDLDIVIGRLSRVYGPTMRDDDSKALAQFIKNAVNNDNIVLKSEGNQLFSYSYVADAVRALFIVMTNGLCGEAYNISDEKSDVQLKYLAQVLAEYNNKDVKFELPDEIEKKGYSTATKAIMDNTKIRKIGYNAKYSMADGLKRTVDILKNLQ